MELPPQSLLVGPGLSFTYSHMKKQMLQCSFNLSLNRLSLSLHSHGLAYFYRDRLSLLYFASVTTAETRDLVRDG